MSKNQKYKDAGDTIWGKRINIQLRQNKMSQKELSEKCGISASTLSGWIGNAGNKKSICPDVEGLQNIADALGVTVSYLLGESECKTLKNEAVCRITGLSDNAISTLKKKHQKSQQETTKSRQNNKMKMLNYLIENIDKTDLLANMYDYLFENFYLQDAVKHDSNFIPIIKTTTQIEGREQALIYGKELRQLYLIDIQENLFELKQNIDKKNAKPEKLERAEFVKWDQTEGRKLKKEDWETEDSMETAGENK